MGTLSYGRSGNTAKFDDRILAHLQLVVAAKLRRSEGFFFTWQHATSTDSGHSSIWISSSIPLLFEYAARAQPAINREWLEKLSLSANSPGGLHLVDEPRAVAPTLPVSLVARSEPALTR